MIYSISTRSEIKKQLATVLCEYYIKSLALQNSKYSLQISFVTAPSKEKLGACIHEGKNIHVQFSCRLSPMDLVRTFGHEMIHVKQIAKGQLKMVPHGSNFDMIWMGKKISMKTPYAKRPWEIEAHAKEEAIFHHIAKQFDL
jgi:hypothetical protein